MLDPTKLIRAAVLTARRLPDPRFSARSEQGFAKGGDVEPPAATAPAPTLEQTVELAKQTLASRPKMPVQKVVQPSVEMPAQPAATSNIDFEGEDHPAWIPQRFIVEKAGRKRDPNDRPKVDMDVLRSTPKLYQKQANIIRGYKNFPESMRSASDDEVMEHFITHVKDNLLTLHDFVEPNIRARSKKWYDGGRRIADSWAEKYGVPNYAVAGSIAALSPQTDWYANVSRAERVLDALKGNGQLAIEPHGLDNFYEDFKFSPQMKDRFFSVDEKGLPYSLNKPVYEPVYNMMAGKSLGDLDRLGLPEKEKAIAKAMWIRLYDEAHNSPEHKIITPEGDFADYVMTNKGERKGAGWGSLVEIAKAIRSAEATQPSQLSELMGEKHKVRNFYNNIISPNSRHGDVTMDTHAIAAALLRPLSGNSLEVAHNLDTSPPAGNPGAGGSDVTGIRGTYPIFAEAYRRAAKERGLLPREMQSITWEAVRSLFSDTFKRGKNSAKVEAVWDRYKTGDISRDEAINQTLEITGATNGLKAPSWHREEPVNQLNAPSPRAGDEGNVPVSGPYGTPTERDIGRAFGGNASSHEESARGGREKQKISADFGSHPAHKIPGIHIVTAHTGEPIFHGDE